jgi:hypothetical protein
MARFLQLSKKGVVKKVDYLEIPSETAQFFLLRYLHNMPAVNRWPFIKNAR